MLISYRCTPLIVVGSQSGVNLRKRESVLPLLAAVNTYDSSARLLSQFPLNFDSFFFPKKHLSATRRTPRASFVVGLTLPIRCFQRYLHPEVRRFLRFRLRCHQSPNHRGTLTPRRHWRTLKEEPAPGIEPTV